MCPSAKTNASYRRLTQLICKLNPKEGKTQQLAQIDYIWSQVESDKKLVKSVIQLLTNEVKLLTR